MKLGRLMENLYFGEFHQTIRGYEVSWSPNDFVTAKNSDGEFYVGDGGSWLWTLYPVSKSGIIDIEHPVHVPKAGPGRTGDWIATFTGKKWYITDPHPDDVCIEDIAHALSMYVRFGGHCREFYSVAEHSVRMARAMEEEGCEPGSVLWGLLHDATEAYLGDMVSPLKRVIPAYKALEVRTEEVILKGLKIDPPTGEARATVKHYDNVMLMTERRDLINHCGHQWKERAKPLRYQIDPLSPAEAREEFLRCFSRMAPILL